MGRGLRSMGGGSSPKIPLLPPGKSACGFGSLITVPRLAANITALAICSDTLYLSHLKQQSIKYLHRIAQLSQSRQDLARR